MRTTLNIDDDVLAAVRRLAQREHLPVGEILSRLARQALQPEACSFAAPQVRYGFAPKHADGHTVSAAQINALRDALGED